MLVFCKILRLYWTGVPVEIALGCGETEIQGHFKHKKTELIKIIMKHWKLHCLLLKSHKIVHPKWEMEALV